MSTIDLKDKVCLVTGASRGIGLAIATGMAAAGAHVAVTARSAEAAEAAATTLGGRAMGIAAHAADEEAATAAVQRVRDEFGRIDALVNNVGTNPAYGPLIRQDVAKLQKTFEINLFAPIMWSRLVFDAGMGEHGGSILNVASIGGMVVETDIGAYNASKSALIHVTQQLAVELAPKVRVNAIAPGIVRTKLAEALWREHEAQLNATTPLARIGEPEDIAGAAVFLSSDAASWITGSVLAIDGGRRLVGPES